ncbi:MULTISPECIES: deoxyguanosinetriphosphate triphosphohydrolase [Rhizobium/Agrobacterium group]|jgi:dGTPase|uniref:Deoxyguanosinetriphosphate triphosphohydrolase-like protein n=3 Tax=Rhizobium/Agrobacterium group TaxID=227290 RepID=A0AB36EPF2_AGRTU|nr:MULTISPECIES: deoxyguanosinetriphosphate triphosphohydrolase [Rhizobium/Agrobacterium group]AHK01567.1 deoxyguanosinetriphosphate triphosphohydrolase [Agrobacterium tumefaciens LBA4213 (Ach5)]AKC07417.1 deoxyguanosinetriphosphate triphosphohydrolase [Agrobacterium tumefaciens]EHJ97603.1 deoxyguanosinetriphosphate triphosphohydrolase-like protein [Agrobacterium tumefaciens 5A]MDP9560407.1 dGTPase [Rhizobium nepotum]QDG93226.1 deoxyguanosinetriphosphate triphosphohydrolase [Rhizobium sp. NIBR
MIIDQRALGFGSGERAVFASDPWTTRGRLFAEEGSLTRSEFQRDRDRIVHTTAFRRLKHKTQVFISPDGDHYRTRLTHTIEVAQIARALARALKLDEDLAEGVALVHDFGHTPFGHTGEDALDAVLLPYGGFDHNAQSLRIVTKLERRYAEYDGINLTWETLEGLVKHNGPLVNAEGEGVKGPVPLPILEYCELQDLEIGSYASLEAQMAAIADDIAYNTHDIDDGLRAGYLSFEMLEEVPFLSKLMAEVRAKYPVLDKERFANEIMRRQITHMVEDVIGVAQQNLSRLKPKSAADIRAADFTVATFSPEMAETDRQIKKLLFAHIYRHPEIMRIRAGATQIVTDLFHRYMEVPAEMQSHYWVDSISGMSKAAKARHVGDYLAGMTDSYALRAHQRLFDHTPDLR